MIFQVRVFQIIEDSVLQLLNTTMMFIKYYAMLDDWQSDESWHQPLKSTSQSFIEGHFLISLTCAN